MLASLKGRILQASLFSLEQYHDHESRLVSTSRVEV